MVEMFFKTIKSELFWRTFFYTRDEAAQAIARYIDGFYNPVRRHSALDYISPAQFERTAARRANASPLYRGKSTADQRLCRTPQARARWRRATCLLCTCASSSRQRAARCRSQPTFSRATPQLYAEEADNRGQSAGARRALRRERSRLIDDLRRVLDMSLGQISRKSGSPRLLVKR
jgi:hypothetical protein